jgi:hypothetical protein
MYSVYCDILSKDGVSHMNDRANLLNDRTVKENGGRTVCIHFLGPLCIHCNMIINKCQFLSTNIHKQRQDNLKICLIISNGISTKHNAQNVLLHLEIGETNSTPGYTWYKREANQNEL